MFLSNTVLCRKFDMVVYFCLRRLFYVMSVSLRETRSKEQENSNDGVSNRTIQCTRVGNTDANWLSVSLRKSNPVPINRFQCERTPFLIKHNPSYLSTSPRGVSLQLAFFADSEASACRYSAYEMNPSWSLSISSRMGSINDWSVSSSCGCESGVDGSAWWSSPSSLVSVGRRRSKKETAAVSRIQRANADLGYSAQGRGKGLLCRWWGGANLFSIIP